MRNFLKHNECKVIVKLKKDAGIIEGNKRKLPGMLGEPDFYIDYEEDVDRALEFFVNIPRDVETLCPLNEIREITFIGNSINDFGRGLIKRKGITLVTILLEFFSQCNLPRSSYTGDYEYQVEVTVSNLGESERLSAVVYRRHLTDKTMDSIRLLSNYSYNHMNKDNIIHFFYQEIITSLLIYPWVKMEPIIDTYTSLSFELGERPSKVENALVEVNALITDLKQK